MRVSIFKNKKQEMHPNTTFIIGLLFMNYITIVVSFDLDEL